MTDALLLSDPRFFQHRSAAYHPERPERLDAAQAAIERARDGGLVFAPVAPRPATPAELARVHTPKFVEWLGGLRGEEGYIDADTYLGPESIAVAELAAGGTVALVDALLDGPVKRGIALVRPPGHHARPDQAMGFCLFNNVAVAAAHARARGLSRVAVIDWDVHHGNGTQEMFYRDPNVLYVSTHQFPFYPGTGAVRETGEGEGEGFTVNVPLTAGGGDGVYRGVFERVILPALEQYAPELVIISAGFDASARDPLAEMALSADAFGWMARALRRVADTSADGRLLLALEGGYDLVALESGLLAATRGITEGVAMEIAREVDHEDIERAAKTAKQAWKVD
ncbi:MAG: histone deacetylase [Labilithrix sp.]|nr:histone deacetylase [Labilithrix sp.]MCW5812955.1 histone deacetylase [Labilithrix sp.]